MLKSIYTIDVRVSKTVFISVKVLHFTHRKEKNIYIQTQICKLNIELLYTSK